MTSLITYLRWIKERFIFLRRVLIELYNKIIYQKESQFILHKFKAHRCPYESMLFYSFFGRFFFSLKEVIALITKDKIFKKSINIDGFDVAIDYAKLYEKGANELLYPKSPMVNTRQTDIEDEYYEKIANSFLLAYQDDNEEKDISNEWDRISKEFRTLFFDNNNKIIKKNLENFRADPEIYAKIFNNQYPYINKKDGYVKSYLTAIDLVLEYHRYASRVDNALLSSLSESTAGNYLSINYRGKKLSEQLIQHMVITNDLVKYVPFSLEKREVILDIGCGFGGSARLLNAYTPNACQILLDLPETLFLTAYYLKYNFPNKKIALLADIYPHLDNLDKVIANYDFIIIPPFVLDYLKADSVDLVVNASSLAFMSEEYLNYYLKETNRLLKNGGYFYSLNSSEDSEWGRGSHNWDYRAEYLTISQGFDNRFSFPQWLGRKIG
ncbi:MAG TPA: putative sugar O-methyltransferase [Campylobacterales bacterium]|nr:putative sugar O-methyltransferase [Campylobacterales bacterium]